MPPLRRLRPSISPANRCNCRGELERPGRQGVLGHDDRLPRPARRRRTSRHCRPDSRRPESRLCPIPAHGFAPGVCGGPSARKSGRSFRWSARTGAPSRSEGGSIPAPGTLLRDSGERTPALAPSAACWRRTSVMRHRQIVGGRSGDRPGSGKRTPWKEFQQAVARLLLRSGHSRRSSHSPAGWDPDLRPSRHVRPDVVARGQQHGRQVGTGSTDRFRTGRGEHAAETRCSCAGGWSSSRSAPNGQT